MQEARGKDVLVVHGVGTQAKGREGGGGKEQKEKRSRRSTTASSSISQQSIASIPWRFSGAGCWKYPRRCHRMWRTHKGRDTPPRLHSVLSSANPQFVPKKRKKRTNQEPHILA